MLQLHRIVEHAQAASSTFLTLSEARDEPVEPGTDWMYGARRRAHREPWAARRPVRSITEKLEDVAPRQHASLPYGKFPMPRPVAPSIRYPWNVHHAGFDWVGGVAAHRRPGRWSAALAYGSLTMFLVMGIGLAVYSALPQADTASGGSNTLVDIDPAPETASVQSGN